MSAENWGNDFVAAYLGGVQQRLAREKQAFDQDQVLKRAPLERERLKAEIDQIHQSSEAAKAQAGYQHEQLKHSLYEQYASGLRKASPGIENPVMPGAQNVQLSPAQNPFDSNSVELPQQQQMSTSQEPSYMGSSAPSSTQFPEIDPRIDPSGFMKLEGVTSPDEIDKRTAKQKILEAQLAIHKAAAMKEAELPSVIAAQDAKQKGVTEGALKLEGAKAANAKEIEEQKRQTALDSAKIHVSGQLAAANISASARRYAADHKTSNALDPQVITDNAMLSATGQGTTPSYTNNGMAVKSVLKKNNFVPFDPKDAEKLKAVNDVNVLFSYMQDEVGKLPDGKVSAFGQRIAAKVPGTDVNNIYNSVFGRAANISHTYGGEIGRLSDPDVQRAMGMLVTPGMTRENAVKNLQQMQLETSSKVLDHILGGQSPKQQLLNLETYKMDPEKFIVKGSDGNFHSKFQKNPQTGAWGVFDPKTLDVTTIK